MVERIYCRQCPDYLGFWKIDHCLYRFGTWLDIELDEWVGDILRSYPVLTAYCIRSKPKL